jgi:peptidoglycan/LPS O-acetylase OafA/YrhL
LLEGLLGYKIPSYLNDLDRRELFRLAHTHGTFLGLVLIAAALSERRGASLPRAASMALSAGSALMPLGFLLAGIKHPEGDPGPAIWLVPPGALLVIFGTVTLALAHLKKNAPPD